MPLNHHAEHGKLTPGHISMVIGPTVCCQGMQRTGGSASLCPHYRGWHGETTGADCACPMAVRIDHVRWYFMYRSRLLTLRGMVARGVAPVITMVDPSLPSAWPREVGQSGISAPPHVHSYIAYAIKLTPLQAPYYVHPPGW